MSFNSSFNNKVNGNGQILQKTLVSSHFRVKNKLSKQIADVSAQKTQLTQFKIEIFHFSPMLISPISNEFFQIITLFSQTIVKEASFELCNSYIDELVQDLPKMFEKICSDFQSQSTCKVHKYICLHEQRSCFLSSTKSSPKLLRKVKLNEKLDEDVHILNLLGV